MQPLLMGSYIRAATFGSLLHAVGELHLNAVDAVDRIDKEDEDEDEGNLEPVLNLGNCLVLGDEAGRC